MKGVNDRNPLLLRILTEEHGMGEEGEQQRRGRKAADGRVVRCGGGRHRAVVATTELGLFRL
jgi:hypothetical protein